MLKYHFNKSKKKKKLFFVDKLKRKINKQTNNHPRELCLQRAKKQQIEDLIRNGDHQIRDTHPGIIVIFQMSCS